MTREELKEHCERQIQQFERVEKIMPVTPNDWKRYEEHKLILKLLEETQQWTPTSERLPKAGEYVGDVIKYYLVQNEYGDMMVARYTHSEYWEQIYKLKPIGDEIVAWRELPEQYIPDRKVREDW